MNPAENRLEVLAFADELSAAPELLAAWGKAFNAEDLVTLIIHPGELASDQVDERLSAAMVAAGLPHDTALDLQAFAGPLTEAEDQAMAQRSVYLLTQSAPRDGFDRLIAVSAEQVSRLRDKLPYPWANLERAPAAHRTIEFAGGTLRFRETDADRNVLKGIFAEESYKLEDYFRFWPGLERYTKSGVSSDGPRPMIIDAGANIGASAIYFAAKYPHSLIIALEPEPNNYALLEENTRRFPNVVPVHKAMSSTHGTFPVSDPGSGGATFRVGQGIARGQIIGYVETMTVADIVSTYPETVPFMFKVDIEGGETELFAGDTESISQFPVVVTELHERMFPGQGSAHPFFRWHLAHDRDFHQSGENSWSFASSLAHVS